MGEITILGAYGAKGLAKETSSFWLNAHHVIDAGNLLRSMQERSADIEAIWLTHSHLDHIVDIAYILDSYFAERTKPLRLMGLPETLQAVRQHLLNDIIWPDFETIPLPGSSQMSIEYTPISLGTSYEIAEEMEIEAFATDHTVPSCGYIVKQGSQRLLITADTLKLDAVIACVRRYKEITALVVECSFPTSMEGLAIESRHLTPKLLFEQLKELEKEGLILYINHMKPIYKAEIEAEIMALCGAWRVVIPDDGDKILF